MSHLAGDVPQVPLPSQVKVSARACNLPPVVRSVLKQYSARVSTITLYVDSTPLTELSPLHVGLALLAQGLISKLNTQASSFPLQAHSSKSTSQLSTTAPIWLAHLPSASYLGSRRRSRSRSATRWVFCALSSDTKNAHFQGTW